MERRNDGRQITIEIFNNNRFRQTEGFDTFTGRIERVGNTLTLYGDDGSAESFRASRHGNIISFAHNRFYWQKLN